jgi:hypothetical protein
MIGGGMSNFMEYCAFPAYCAKGNHLMTINLFDNPPRCRKHRAEPTPYDDAALIGELGENVVASWNYDERTATLTDGYYFCPACHNFTLRFSDYGPMWD